jgi:hypothetical protein
MENSGGSVVGGSVSSIGGSISSVVDSGVETGCDSIVTDVMLSSLIGLVVEFVGSFEVSCLLEHAAVDSMMPMINKNKIAHLNTRN